MIRKIYLNKNNELQFFFKRCLEPKIGYEMLQIVFRSIFRKFTNRFIYKRNFLYPKKIRKISETINNEKKNISFKNPKIKKGHSRLKLATNWYEF